MKGVWKYLYRAVDSRGNTLDFMLSVKRDGKAAERFCRKVLKATHTQSPRVITVDKNAAYPKADETLPEVTELRQKKYLNNIIEQDHRAIKRLMKAGMGFKSFNAARRTLRGYEAMNMFRKDQIQGVEKDLIELDLFHPPALWSSCIEYFFSKKYSVHRIFLQHNPGTCHKTLQGHTDASGSEDASARWVTSLSFSPSGQTLASGGEDASVRFWSVQDGTCFKLLQGHSSCVWAVAFNPDGQTLASGSEDASVRLWDVQPKWHLPQNVSGTNQWGSFSQL